MSVHSPDGFPQFRIQNVDLDHPALQVAMPLVSTHDGDREGRCIGTAFLVAPGLAITAYHVVEDWQMYQEDRDGYKRPGATYTVHAFQWLEGKWRVWTLDDIYPLGVADIAFLRFQRPAWWGIDKDQVQSRFARINVNPPQSGEEVRIFGFPESFIKDSVLHIEPSECVARVETVTIRNPNPSRLRPTAFVELTGETHGAMSGGPCFDANWDIVGMVSNGLDLDSTMPPLSRMALLWPAMGVPIDLYKENPFPAWNLFKEGPLQAIGHRRIHVARGKTRFSAVDPASLVPIRYLPPRLHLEGALNFALENAWKALTDTQAWIQAAVNTVTGDWNDLYRSLRHFFWELETAMQLSVQIAASQATFTVDCPVQWDRFVATWRDDPNTDSEVRDALADLNFTWHSTDLFEIRTYAEMARSSVLIVQCMTNQSGVAHHCSLDACRKGGAQVSIPDGLTHYGVTTNRFAGKLLRLAETVFPGVLPNSVASEPQVVNNENDSSKAS